jgi:Mg2+ and Co2+ transporter CorA
MRSTTAATSLAMVVDAAGVRPLTSDVDGQDVATTFCWVDVFGGEDSERKTLLTELGLDDAELAAAVRLGQAGRMVVGRRRLRAVTWLAEPSGQLIEIHLLCSQRGIVTVWRGNPSALDDVRQHFAERIGGVEKSPYQAAGMLLQLLLGTLDHAVRDLDARLENVRVRLDQGGAGSVDLAPLVAQRQELQGAWINFNRYSSAVRAAIVGIEAVPGVDARAAAELNDYAEQVEDIEEQLLERRRWMTEIMHDSATAIAQRQGEQINRLTLVSLIFLPVTAVTGFFSMNFSWMIDALKNAFAFFALGVVLPALMVLLTVAWLMHRGILQFAPRRPPKDVRDR